MYQEEILSISNFRYILIEQQNQSETNDTNYLELNDKIDELAKEIENLIQSYFEQLPFEFIIEELSKLGHTPNLLYDDNGHWAVSADGYQNVVSGDVPEDVETHFYIEAEDWKNSPKEALYKFLHDDNSEE